MGSILAIAIEIVWEPMFLMLVSCGILYQVLGDIFARGRKKTGRKRYRKRGQAKSTLGWLWAFVFRWLFS